MSRELPYFRWYPGDAESDSKYVAMTFAERGLYHKALNYAWMNDGLPIEDSEVGRVLKMTVRELNSIWPRVRQCFEEVNAKLCNRRQEEERSYAKNKSERATESIRKRYERSSDDPPRAYGSDTVSSSAVVVSSKEKKRDEILAWFEDDFWPLYPRKVGRPEALRAARKVATTPELRAEIISGLTGLLPDYAARDVAHVKHPGPWLNGERWKDQFTPPLSFGDSHALQRRETATEASIRVAMGYVATTGRL